MKQATRDQLIEAAGQVFAERGFEAATGKEICERAGLAAAAINYHFGGVRALYEATLAEARSRLFSFEDLTRAATTPGSAETRLRNILRAFVKATSGPVSTSWVVRVLGRELVAPSGDYASLRAQTHARAGLLKAVVGDFMQLPPDHPAVARGCVSLIGPFLLLMIANRKHLESALPQLRLEPKEAEALTDDMTDYALAGLTAVAASERQKARKPSKP